MRDQRQTPVGTDLVAMTLRGGVQCRGIVVDNPSGSWLFVAPVNDFIPPYTVGWGRNLLTPSLSVSVKFTPGPGGQVSTRAGDPVTVWMDSEPIGDSTGTPSGYIEGFTPVQIVNNVTAWPASATAPLQNLVPAVANRRLRLVSVSVASVTSNWLAGIIGPGAVYVGDVALQWALHTNALGTAFVIGGGLGAGQVSDYNAFAPGVDLAVGAGVWLFVSPDPWADALVNFTLRYLIT